MVEHNIPSHEVMSESIRIRDELLAIEEVVAERTTGLRAQLLEGVRDRLGYDEPDVVDGYDLVDSRIESKVPVITPESLNVLLPLSQASAETTRQGRQDIADVIRHKDDRLFVMAGPCSIHDPKSAMEYAGQLNDLRERYQDDLVVVMRTYPDKPRTELGWKGFVYDPLLDGSNDMNLGVIATRMLLGQITDMGMPTAMERLNGLTPQYFNGLVAYDAIGARNTTDQNSRLYASGTSSPVGFKNTPEGSVKAAVEATVAAAGAHSFLGMSMNGVISQVNTLGNDLGHVILRGSSNGPNYSAEHIAHAVGVIEAKEAELAAKGIHLSMNRSIVVDTSHGNKTAGQMAVVRDISAQLRTGRVEIVGAMIESHLVAGAQKLGDPAELVYGQSITDACVSIDETAEMLSYLAGAVQHRRMAA